MTRPNIQSFLERAFFGTFGTLAQVAAVVTYSGCLLMCKPILGYWRKYVKRKKKSLPRHVWLAMYAADQAHRVCRVYLEV